MEADLQTLWDVLDDSPLRRRYWLIGGIVLGLQREGRLLPHDTDADFGITDPELLRQSLGRLADAGFQPHEVWRNNAGTATEWTFLKHGRKFEFFRHFAQCGNYIWYAYHGKRRVQLLRSMPLYAWDDRTFLDRTWLIPEDAECYLQRQYGDWKTRSPGWNYITDCPSHVAREPWHGTRQWDLDW